MKLLAEESLLQGIDQSLYIKVQCILWLFVSFALHYCDQGISQLVVKLFFHSWIVTVRLRLIILQYMDVQCLIKNFFLYKKIYHLQAKLLAEES